MDIRALFFATYRDLVGTPSLTVTLEPPATVAGLITRLRERGAPFDRLPERPAVALNREYVADDAPLSAGDEVAFIPPVAGG
jgi:molybdopterin synthase sulfur carrier subunit